MDHSVLGRTGLKVSVAGLGCGGFSRLGLSTGKTEAEAMALVRNALDQGVNFLDTARSYETEHIVGQRSKGARATAWSSPAKAMCIEATNFCRQAIWPTISICR